MLRKNRTHGVPIVAVIVVHFAVSTIEVEFVSIVDILATQRSRPIVSVRSNVVNLTIVSVTNGREEQKPCFGHYL